MLHGESGDVLTTSIVGEDLDFIFHKLGEEAKKKFCDSTVMITGCAGFLGFYFLQFFSRYFDDLEIKRVIGLDNFMLRRPSWLNSLDLRDGKIEIHPFDIIKESIHSVPAAVHADYVVHLASIASPTFYRKYPIEALDANVWGLRNLLDFYARRQVRGVLFFSSSEVYGDPPPEYIPTDEEYRGNVSTIGPRACYDESKRISETICYLFAKRYDLPISIARPFNNYGPGMNLEDKRVPADFARAVVEGRDIEIFSDGSPTRTFCYVADAIVGYLKILTLGHFDYFNIGIEEPEISISALADLYAVAGTEIFGYNGRVILSPPPEREYLTHNPNRRCPNIQKARNLLGYEPEVRVNQGVRKFLSFLKQEK